MQKIEKEKRGFMEIVWEFDNFIDTLLAHPICIDLDNDQVATKAIELATRYKTALDDDHIFGHLMDYARHGDEHARNCTHCRLLREADELVEKIRHRHATAWKMISALDELWNGPRLKTRPPY